MKLAVIYALLAAIATVVNIGCQELSVISYQGEYSLYISILVGTIAGLLVKYVLDKKYIFRYQTNDSLHDTKLFALYAGMGVFTTVIFWGTELAFEMVFQSKTWRYIGGVLGLAVGYIVKYHLDKKFVFVEQAEQ